MLITVFLYKRKKKKLHHIHITFISTLLLNAEERRGSSSLH